MKKLVFAAVAAIALTASVSFVACNKPVPAQDSTAVDTTAIEDVIEAVDSVADSVAAVVDSIAD